MLRKWRAKNDRRFIGLGQARVIDNNFITAPTMFSGGYGTVTGTLAITYNYVVPDAGNSAVMFALSLATCIHLRRVNRRHGGMGRGHGGAAAPSARCAPPASIQRLACGD